MIDFGLEACPCCGGEAEIVALAQGPEHLDATIKCTDCGLTLVWKTEFSVSVSRSGKNVAVKGFMNKLGELISNTLYDFGRVVDAYGTETMRYGIVSPPGIETPMVYNVMPVWSLKTYRENLKTDLNESDQAGQAWDEMEKSIVANLADDVIVGVKGDCIELVIVKNLKG